MSDTNGFYVTAPGLIVGGDLSAQQYHAVKMASTADTIIAMAASTDVAVGVLMDAPDASGEAATVAVSGIVTVIAGTGTLAAGARFQFDGTGQVIAASGQDLGVLLEAKSAQGDSLRAKLD